MQKISVVIPNYQGAKFLAGCLDSLLAQTRPADEIIVADDASRDDSVALIRTKYPQVKLLVRAINSGFAACANTGLDAATGDIICLFNNDAEAAPEWLAVIEATLNARPEISTLASSIRLYDRRDVFHAVGDFYRANGIPGNRGVWQTDIGQYEQTEEVFGACAAASVYRREALAAVRADNPDGKVFDERLFMYCEDVDLNLRLRLRGLRCLYVPNARVYHRLSATGGGTLASFYNGRNFITVALKNLPTSILLGNLFNIILKQLSYALFSLRHIRLDTERARLKGQWAALRQLKQTLTQRAIVQKNRTVSTTYMLALLDYHQ
jgi:GT2 family glycosyltransferase